MYARTNDGSESETSASQPSTSLVRCPDCSQPRFFKVCLGQLAAGYMQGWTVPVIPKLQDPEQTPLDDVITEAQASWLGSVAIFGGISAPFTAGYLPNRVGRKPCLFLSGSVLAIGYGIMALAKSLAMIYIGRVITGVGTGNIMIINLVYLGEMGSPNIRGRLLTLTGLFTTLGILLAYSVGPFVSYAMTAWLTCGVGVIYSVVICFIPETPTYQILKGKKEEAIANLISLGRKEDIDSVIKAATEDTKPKITQLTEMFTVQTNRKALFIVASLLSFQQLSGVIAVIFFATTIFEQTGLSLDANISTIIIGVTQVFAAALAPLVVEKTGRRPLLLVSTAACAVSLGLLGIYFYMYMIEHPVIESIQWLSITSLIMFFIFYFSGFGIIPNTFCGEMFTANVGSYASALTMTLSWFVSFGVSTGFGYMVPAWGAHTTFWMYSGGSFLAFLFTLMFVPETKGKTLLEIRELLKN